ncbi:MAG TPA: hypothetical protein VF202_02180 [Trueperaceae bacterium]
MTRELLEKWAALEPDWCRVDDERASVMADVGTPLERPRFTAQYHRLGQYEPDILAAVIEAVEARGWDWMLWGDGKGTREGCVRVPSTDLKRLDTPYGPGLVQVSPAEALLAAYLAALEAEGAS